VNAQKLALFQLTEDPGIANGIAPSCSASQTDTCYYFGGKMTKNEKTRCTRIAWAPSATANGTENLAVYLGDAVGKIHLPR
jgi:hypothetical protein